jgi:hypothetical protein
MNVTGYQQRKIMHIMYMQVYLANGLSDVFNCIQLSNFRMEIYCSFPKQWPVLRPREF